MNQHEILSLDEYKSPIRAGFIFLTKSTMPLVRSLVMKKEHTPMRFRKNRHWKKFGINPCKASNL
jgi:hypothetical protein